MALAMVGCDLTFPQEKCVEWKDGQCLAWEDIDTAQPAVDGTDGLSAYELAVVGGFVGTLEEWLESLQGEEGIDGTDGLSAYELAVAGGYEGTLEEWLVSLILQDDEIILCPSELNADDANIHFIIWYTRDDITDVKMQHYIDVELFPQLKSSKASGAPGMTVEDRNGTTIIRSSFPIESEIAGEHAMGINFTQGI